MGKNRKSWSQLKDQIMEKLAGMEDDYSTVDSGGEELHLGRVKRWILLGTGSAMIVGIIALVGVLRVHGAELEAGTRVTVEQEIPAVPNDSTIGDTIGTDQISILEQLAGEFGLSKEELVDLIQNYEIREEFLTQLSEETLLSQEEILTILEQYELNDSQALAELAAGYLELKRQLESQLEEIRLSAGNLNLLREELTTALNQNFGLLDQRMTKLQSELDQTEAERKDLTQRIALLETKLKDFDGLTSKVEELTKMQTELKDISERMAALEKQGSAQKETLEKLTGGTLSYRYQEETNTLYLSPMTTE